MFIEKKAFPSLKLENVTIKIFEFLLVNDYKKNVSQWPIWLRFQVIVLMLVLVAMAWSAPLDQDPTNPAKSEDFDSPTDPRGSLLFLKKMKLKKLLLLG